VTRNPELVNASDLDAYAELRPREAQELLPHLMRRLLANTRALPECRCGLAAASG
jgi:hypothetical protein